VSDDDKVIQKKWDVKNLPKTFMSPAYVVEKEPGVFAMYRDVTIEENGVREKFGKPIGPMYLFRECKASEKEDFLTSRPDGTVLRLWRFHPPKEEILPPDFQPK
jgi:hypothetical protein